MLSPLSQPDMSTTCCKPYTIRLDVTQFQPDRAQARLIRKWRGFLADVDVQLAEGAQTATCARLQCIPPNASVRWAQASAPRGWGVWSLRAFAVPAHTSTGRYMRIRLHA